MERNFWTYWGGLLVPLLIVGCGSLQSAEDLAASAGTSTSDTIEITGSVQGRSANLAKGSSSAATGCEADTVVATDSDDDTIEGDVDEDCNFSIRVPHGRSYALSLLLRGTFVASLAYESGISGFSTPLLPLLLSRRPIVLGPIVIVGTRGTPTYQPLAYVDSDGDGIMDADDSDDDNDGVDDAQEDDCDADGIADDFDESVDCSDVNTNTSLARVLVARPHHNRGCRLLHRLGRKGRCHRVPLRRAVTAWVNCRVDRTTVTAETFRVEADGEAVDCHYRFKRWKLRPRKAHILRCRHRSDPFAADAIYTATIDGVLCKDGTPVAPRSWSWLTVTAARADLDASDADDEIDTCEEIEDDDADAEEDAEPIG
jgi:hypothetical protein